MKVTLGKEGLGCTWQAAFPKTTGCCRCDGEARIGFVVQEQQGEKGYVADLHPNEPDGSGFWLHDACAVAVYFCRKCLMPTALYNQA